MVKETTKSSKELRTNENFQKLWDEAMVIMVIVSKNNKLLNINYTK